MSDLSIRLTIEVTTGAVDEVDSTVVAEEAGAGDAAANCCRGSLNAIWPDFRETGEEKEPDESIGSGLLAEGGRGGRRGETGGGGGGFATSPLF